MSKPIEPDRLALARACAGANARSNLRQLLAELLEDRDYWIARALHAEEICEDQR